MPTPVDYDLSQISTHIIIYSDRVHTGAKEDRTTPACVVALAEAGLGPVSIMTTPESDTILELEIRNALEAGARFILILGGSGFGVGNYAPEVVRSIIEVEIPGIAARGRGRDRARRLGRAHHLLAGFARRRARHPRGRDASPARDLPPARRAALTPPSPLPLLARAPPKKSHVIWFPLVF